MTTVERTSVAPWKRCNFCHDIVFKSPQDFSLHLRNSHCKKEGGSYVCCYGNNNVCSSLPFEGVSDQDYEFHVVKHHVLSLTGDDGSFHEENFVENLRQKYAHIFNASHSVEQPNVVMDQYQWTIYNSTQNLPAVLNDPRRSKREWDFFIKTWGDSFTENATLPPCPFIPEISWIHFEWYLKQTRKRFRRHARQALAGSTSSDRKVVPAVNQFLPLSGKQGNASAEIEDVPKIFMQADFNLENPDVFNTVIPWSQLYGHNPSDKILPQRNSVKLLQEKLSHYLDIIEVQIAKQISVRSEAFFHAMTSHDALKDQLTCVIKSVCELRSRIHVVEEELVKGPMKILKLKRTQRNFLQVYHKLKSMATVHQTQLTIQLLLSRSEFVGALDLIYTTQEVLSQELAGVHSFRHLSSQLAEIEKVIDKMMQTDFVRYVAADLNRPHEEGKLVMEEDRLVAILLGMLRQHQYGFIEIFKDECYTAIKATVKQTVIEVISEFEDVEIESNTGNLSEQVRSLTFQRWIDLLNQVFENMNFLLKRILALYEVIDETTDVAAGKSVSSSSENLQQCPVLHLLEGENEVMIPEKDYVTVKSSLKDLLSSVCDHAHECCGKLLSAKSKDDSLDKLSTSEFVLLAQTVESFQTVSGKQRTSLQLLLKTQAVKFVSRFHEERKTKLNLILENEQWKQADVPMEFQDLVSNIISSGSLTKQKKNIEDDSSQRKPQQYLFVGDENFAVTGTVLMLLKMMVEYCQCADDVPMVTADLTIRLPDLLKVFNSRTCQLVLGAGALQLLGLKTITVRHLALASRCLQLIVYFIPHVKRHFQERVSCKQQNPIKHFDQILKDYNDHIEEISLKVESIVSNMFEAQLRKWEVKAPVPSPCFTAISKQLNRVHELVHDLLPPVQLQDIFMKTHNTFIEKLSCHLDRLKVKNDGGPQHGLVVQELTFYTQNLKKLKVPCDYNMNDLWNVR